MLMRSPARNSARSSWPGCSRMVRLHRSMTRTFKGARRTRQTAKMGVELGRAPGDVEGRNSLARQKREHHVDSLCRHLLGALGPAFTWQCEQD